MPTVAFRVNRSRRTFVNYQVVRQVLGDAMDNEVKPRFIKRFEGVVANWKHKPKFEARKFITQDSLSLNVYPSGTNKEIYQYVTKGTPPHTIAARNAPSLIFMWGGPGSYKPKTAPGGKIGGPGVVVGGKLRGAKSVHHPGFEGRNFEKVIAKDESAWFSKTMSNAWRRAIRAMQK